MFILHQPAESVKKKRMYKNRRFFLRFLLSAIFYKH